MSSLNFTETRQHSRQAKNVFSSPWKKSDVVLVVEGTEYHVHRSILAIQSPVFESMFNGHFKEARQKKITLKGKTSEDMLQFLKLLYPPNMIKAPLISFTGEDVLKILALADEYQAEDVLNQCLEETEIVAENALGILPYATKYNKSVCKKCITVITRQISTYELEEELPTFDTKIVKNLLTKKCYHLESIAEQEEHFIILLLKKLLKGIKPTSYSYTLTCGHVLDISEFHQTRGCENCLLQYRKQFIERALSPPLCKYSRSSLEESESGVNDVDRLFDLLKSIDDALQ